MAAGAIRYGFGYQGSKNKICRWLIEHLPRWKRFVDLFGGGFAVSHAALLSGKYKTVYYNELDADIVEIVRRHILNREQVPKEWVSREDFFRLKDKEPVVSLFWSFNQSRNSYLYSQEIEPWKKALHYAVVFRDYTLIDEYDTRIKSIIDDDTIEKRRLNCKKGNGLLYGIVKNAKRLDELDYKYSPKCKPNYTVAPRKDILDFLKIDNTESLESLESLERLQSLESLQSLETNNLQVSCGSYLDYYYLEGDVVYCDPPYENTEQKGYSGSKKESGFDSKQFYDWVFSRPYQVFFSSYEISDDRFYELDKIEKINNFTGQGGGKKNIERLYSNKPFAGAKKSEQTTIFDFLKE